MNLFSEENIGSLQVTKQSKDQLINTLCQLKTHGHTEFIKILYKLKHG